MHRNKFLIVSTMAASLAIAPFLPAQTLTVLHSFGADGDGVSPVGGLAASGNTVYGTTVFGGTNEPGLGTVFAINADGSDYKILYNFSSVTNGTNYDGGFPEDVPVISGGMLYGTATSWGPHGSGTVFSLNAGGGGFSTLYGFTGESDGADPIMGLTLAGGTLYGTTFSGPEDGSMFALGTGGSNFKTIYDFEDGGITLYGSLVSAGDTFYGQGGIGAQGFGAVFSVHTNGTGYTELYSFTDGADGGTPYSGLTLAGDTLYGTTFEGKSTGGAVFSIKTNGSAFTFLHTFPPSGTTEGWGSQAVLTVSGTVVYGTTVFGGTANAGTIFSVNTDGSGFQTLYSFKNGSDGSMPNAQMALVGNKLCGTTGIGGSQISGTLFSLTLPGVGAGALQVTLTPSNAVSAGAQWQVDGGAAQNSGATVSNLSIGSHTVSFTSAAGFITPANQTVAVSSNATTTAIGKYFTNGSGATGSLTVTLLPDGAVSAGAMWQVDFGSNQSSGATVANLSVGSHTVTFSDISGWGTPAEQDIAISSNQTTTATGYYTQLTTAGTTGSVTVTLEPDAVVDFGATWSIDGGAAETNGVTVSNLSLGLHTISFSFVFGWVAPPTRNINIIPGATLPVVGLYTPAPPPVDGLELITNGFGSIQHSAWPKGLVPGKNYTVKAVPDAKNFFSNWLGGTNYPFAVLGTSPTLTFTMVSNLTLEANFVTNLFLAVEGSYKGLFAPPIGARAQTNSGAISLAISSMGSVSGNLLVGGRSIGFAGKFGLDATANITIKQPRAPNPLLIFLRLDPAGQAVTGYVSDNVFYSTLTVYREPIPNSQLVSNFAGQYTVVIPGTNPASIGPFGTSYGAVKVDNMGHVTISGSLADGTSFNQSSIVFANGLSPLYVGLYAGQGSLWGWMQFSNQTVASAPNISWINLTNSSKAARYQSGFNDQQATLTGVSYNPAIPLSSDLVAMLQGGDLLTNITITNIVGNTNNLVFNVNQKTGIVTGSFANPQVPQKSIKVSGVVLQGQTNVVEGYFLGFDSSGLFRLAAP